MALPFLDRDREAARLARALDGRGAFICLYGRRRLGKSRLLIEALRSRTAVYYVGDERDAPIQRAALSREIASRVPGFAEVRYDGWEPLLSRWTREAPPGAVLALDELPSLVTTSPELPSLLQKMLDSRARNDLSLVLCGSSQRMMHGLVLDGAAPLYGRATEILRIGPLPVGWVAEAFGLGDAPGIVERYTTWGGVPRYWELASRYEEHDDALVDLCLDPMGVLHQEPDRLLLDEVTEVARPASVLSLVARGCHRASEIAGRVGVPVTSLARVLAKLLDLGLLVKDIPFGEDERSKKGLYRVGDPHLRFHFRFVEPNRSRLASGQMKRVLAEVRKGLPRLVGDTWEELSRESTARLQLLGSTWLAASRYWGKTREGLMELDIVAENADDPEHVLVGEAKRTVSAREVPRLLADLEARAARCPALAGRRITTALWVLDGARASKHVVSGRQVVHALR